MSTSEKLLSQYEGEFVPRFVESGFVVLSYFVSCIGAILTLELLNRRTSRHGLFNYLILVSSALSMGGISIWCMHFVGNRAITLGHDEPELRIDYSSGFSALSFFLPVIVLLAAFMALGANFKVSWYRLSCGGVLAGAAICGMHYMGNLSISNYHCVYDNVYVVGAALFAVFDSIVALSLFFVFRASWRNTWWKRVLSACVLAGAVSGMHWVAAAGTNYRLIRLNESSQLSQTHAIIVAICLSIAAALFIAGSVSYATWIMRRNRNRARQVILATAVFDQSGRILVNPDGLLPSEKITDTYVERTPGDTFSIAHPIFHWMFQVSRNWNSVSGMVDGMANHLAHLPRGIRDSKIRLIDDDGRPIENYDAIFRELFCVAAVGLADKLKEQLVNVGILWDEILATGIDALPQGLNHGIENALEEGIANHFTRAREGRIGRQQECGRGSLMFLVRRLENSHDEIRLEAAGFRFADIHQVCGIIGSGMHIKTKDLKGKLTNMAMSSGGNTVMEPGVHLGFFGVKAQVGSFGFDVIVKKGARNLLPTMPIPLERLEPWQMDIVRRFDRMSVPLLFQNLDALKLLSPREVLFASQLSDALQALRAWIDDPIFDESVLTSKVVQAPCRVQAGSNSTKSCAMIALYIMMPIHASADSPRCEFIPLNFFKVQQMVYKNSPHLTGFARYVHRELSPIVNSVPLATYQQCGKVLSRWHRSGFLHRLGRLNTKNYAVVEDSSTTSTKFRRNSSSQDSSRSRSSVKLWNQDPHDRQGLSNDTLPPKTVTHPQSSGLGGIMVSQEIQVDIRQIDDAVGGPTVPLKTASKMDRVTMVKAGSGFDFEMDYLPEEEDTHLGKPLGSAVAEREKVNEVITFVDELFAVCIDGL
ncbi:hypothetical protein F4677DRAFT_125462 [Hypoxylon crocopeplum]|nr:hypothetical protein F4677DRAFT_125462 [Hypoxylon crocopeplum]